MQNESMSMNFNDDRCRATYVHKMVRTNSPISCNVCGNTDVDDAWRVTTGPRCTACIALPIQRSVIDNIVTAENRNKN